MSSWLVHENRDEASGSSSVFVDKLSVNLRASERRCSEAVD